MECLSHHSRCPRFPGRGAILDGKCFGNGGAPSSSFGRDRATTGTGGEKVTSADREILVTRTFLFRATDFAWTETCSAEVFGYCPNSGWRQRRSGREIYEQGRRDCTVLASQPHRPRAVAKLFPIDCVRNVVQICANVTCFIRWESDLSAEGAGHVRRRSRPG